MDGVLGGQRHRAVLRVYGQTRGATVTCAHAYRPLVGMQHVAWRFMRPDTLVYAVRTAGCSGAVSGPADATTLSASAADEEDEGKEEEEEEEEVEEGGCGYGTTTRPLSQLAPHAHPESGALASGSMHTIRVSCPS